MVDSLDSPDLPTVLPLPTTPRAIAQSVGTGFMPVIYRSDGKTEAQRFERLPRKTKLTPEAALRHAELVIWYRQIRTNEAKRRLAAISNPWWVETVARLNLHPMGAHEPVNRDRDSFKAWDC